jgi:hypothetical protein
MIESPVLQRFAANQQHKGMLKLLTITLQDRFGTIPEDVIATLQAIKDEASLIRLDRLANRCPDFETFRAELTTISNGLATSEESLP